MLEGSVNLSLTCTGSTGITESCLKEKVHLLILKFHGTAHDKLHLAIILKRKKKPTCQQKPGAAYEMHLIKLSMKAHMKAVC